MGAKESNREWGLFKSRILRQERSLGHSARGRHLPGVQRMSWRKIKNKKKEKIRKCVYGTILKEEKKGKSRIPWQRVNRE